MCKILSLWIYRCSYQFIRSKKHDKATPVGIYDYSWTVKGFRHRSSSVSLILE